VGAALKLGVKSSQRCTLNLTFKMSVGVLIENLPHMTDLIARRLEPRIGIMHQSRAGILLRIGSWLSPPVLDPSPKHRSWSIESILKVFVVEQVLPFT
jgi:hypothetical protein